MAQATFGKPAGALFRAGPVPGTLAAPARSWGYRAQFCVGAILDRFWTELTFSSNGYA
jgi:hypothetical protein